VAEFPLQPKSPLEQELQKLLTSLRRDCDLDMGHEVSRYLASDTWRSPFKDTREFLDRLYVAHTTAAATIDAYLVKHALREPDEPAKEPTDG